MKPSFYARQLRGTACDRLVVAREALVAWVERFFVVIALVVLLGAYLLMGYFDRLDHERSRYEQIERTQKRVMAELDRARWCDPAYFIVEARSPQDAADKLLLLTLHVDAERLTLLNVRDLEKAP